MQFDTYEKLVDYCYPYSKNLATKGLTTDRISFLLNVEKIYQQQVDKYAAMLGIRRETKVVLSRSSRYMGRCWYSLNIIELDARLICDHPLILAETIIHELTHYKYHNHKLEFYLGMEKYVRILGLQDKLYGFTSEGKFPASIDDYYNDHLSDALPLFLFKRVPSLDMVNSYASKKKIKLEKDDVLKIIEHSYLCDSRQRVRKPDDVWFENVINKNIKSCNKQLSLFE